MWCQDEAGPYPTRAFDGSSWQVQGQPQKQDAEYIRAGTAKMLTLLHPQSGQVRVKGVEQTTNAILHPWLKSELEAILTTLPPSPEHSLEENRALWASWQADMTVKYTLARDPVPLRMILVWDNLIGHHSGNIVLWLYQHGIMPLFTPIKGSWLNMAESVQRIIVRRGLDGTHPTSPTEIITSLEGAATGWNKMPTPFVWGGTRRARRERARLRRLGGSGAMIHPLYRAP